MVVSFKKTAECQYRHNDHYWSSLGHRRLRFSFQIYNVKDRAGSAGPHCLTPVRGGGGDLGAGRFPVKRPFTDRVKKSANGGVSGGGNVGGVWARGSLRTWHRPKGATLDKASQETFHRLPFLVGEALKEVGVMLVGNRSQSRDQCLAVGGEKKRVGTAIGVVFTFGDQSFVDQAVRQFADRAMSQSKPVSQSAWRDGFDTEQLAQNCPFSDRHPVPGESDA